MYAVFKLGGTQHSATVGDVLDVQKVEGEVGHKFEIAEVLCLRKDDQPLVGTPLVQGAKVVAEIVRQSRAGKVVVIKFKRRKNYRRKRGHKQPMTRIKVTDIVVA
jgi:large subunit ribosomal protein L21